jgi:putative mRNA 3-end processing factor
VWVVSGDYKRAPDPTCAAFEPVACDTFVTEATFALPIYRWPEPSVVARDLFDWWEGNRAAGRASVLFCYALGKAQRVLAELRAFTDRTVYVHGAIDVMCELYRAAGVALLPTTKVIEKQRFAGELVLAPVAAQNTKWLRRIGDYESAFASGWMQVRGERRRRALDRGFVLSDHADWPALLKTIEECGAEHVIATHGHSATLARYLREAGADAQAWDTHFEGEAE